MRTNAAGSDLHEAPDPKRNGLHNGSKLRLICVGTGRDGTMSLSRMIQEIYDRIGGGRVMHEYCAREFYNAFCNYQETKNPAYLAEIRAMIDECPYECIVGNGYAPILPIVSERLAELNVALIHLRRTNADACVGSLKLNAELFPAAYGYYVESPRVAVKRMAAFHFNEMPRSAWDALSLEDKLHWYYNKTHLLVCESEHFFGKQMKVATEDLDSLETRRALSQFISGMPMDAPSPVRINAHMIDANAFPRESWDKMQWLLGGCDLRKLAEDDVYVIEYFLDRFVHLGTQWATALSSGTVSCEKRRDIATMLDNARGVVWRAHERIEALQAIPELGGDTPLITRQTTTLDTERMSSASRIQAAEARPQQLEANLEAETARIDELQAHICEMTVQIGRLQTALEAERLAAAARIVEIEEARWVESLAAATHIEELQSTLKKAREAEHAVAAIRVSELEAKLEEERRTGAAQLAAVRAEVEMLQATLSWRVTEPLRAIRRASLQLTAKARPV